MGGSLAELQHGRHLAAQQNRYALPVRRFNPDHDYPEVRCARHICAKSPKVLRVAGRPWWPVWQASLTRVSCGWACPAAQVASGTKLSLVRLQDVRRWLPMVIEDCQPWMPAESAPCVKQAAGADSNLIIAQAGHS